MHTLIHIQYIHRHAHLLIYVSNFPKDHNLIFKKTNIYVHTNKMISCGFYSGDF